MFTVRLRHIGMNRESIPKVFDTLEAAETAALAINCKPFCPYYAWVDKPTPRTSGEHRYNGFY